MGRLKKINYKYGEIYNYYLAKREDIQGLCNEEILENKRKGNRIHLSDLMSAYMQEYFCETMFPVKVGNEEYNDIVGVKLFHGFKDFSHGANFLWDYDRHYGYGIYGGGFYTTTSKADAYDYTKKDYEKNEDKVIELKLISRNIVNYDDILELSRYLSNTDDVTFKRAYTGLSDDKKANLDEFMSFLESTNDPEFKKNILNSASNLALILGYDAIWHKKKINDDYHFIILKPDKLVVSKSEFDRVMTAAGGSYAEAAKR